MPDETPPEDDVPFIVRRALAPAPRRLGRSLTDAELLAEIGRELRHAYSELLREPIPEHLAIIIAKLEARTDPH